MAKTIRILVKLHAIQPRQISNPGFRWRRYTRGSYEKD